MKLNIPLILFIIALVSCVGKGNKDHYSLNFCDDQTIQNIPQAISGKLISVTNQTETDINPNITNLQILNYVNPTFLPSDEIPNAKSCLQSLDKGLRCDEEHLGTIVSWTQQDTDMILTLDLNCLKNSAPIHCYLFEGAVDNIFEIEWSSDQTQLTLNLIYQFGNEDEINIRMILDIGEYSAEADLEAYSCEIDCVTDFGSLFGDYQPPDRTCSYSCTDGLEGSYTVYESESSDIANQIFQFNDCRINSWIPTNFKESVDIPL